ncbi:KTSC domain-containing protein [Natronomonas gomsonensis]|uniref:KTSC domain-containing protein n=1 Tax=Natronomonas gomsonensis TaxID=1046043 RepID=UPI00227AC900|nr:KTSC domain-containing protein [Natronomonas gomsonensis]MCY4732110.1 KTSC domain-containing protein [Natronomonas gomsonensis]
MEREPVSSSLVESVGYDLAEATLEGELENGRVYQYRDVPKSTHQEFRAADSLGRYFNRCIRGLSHVRMR